MKRVFFRSLAAVIEPPCSSTTCFAIASPSTLCAARANTPYHTADASVNTANARSRIFFRNLRYSFFNFISYSPDGLDEITPACSVTQLFTQMPDVYHHRIVAVFEIFFFPDLLEKLLGADHLAPV